jgi:hypothetical protein
MLESITLPAITLVFAKVIILVGLVACHLIGVSGAHLCFFNAFVLVQKPWWLLHLFWRSNFFIINSRDS